MRAHTRTIQVVHERYRYQGFDRFGRDFLDVAIDLHGAVTFTGIDGTRE